VPDNQITPQDALGDADRILAQAAVSRNGKVLKQPQQAKPSKAEKLQTVGTLLITDAKDKEVKKWGELYARYALKGAEVKYTNSWNELLMVLEKYETIRQLVLFMHGTPGSLVIGDVNRGLESIAAEWKDRRLPKVNDQIDFEACSVGEGADKVVEFARLFKAPRFTAWNHFHVIGEMRVDIPKNPDAESLKQLKQKLARLSTYFIPGTPSAEDLTSQRPSKHTLGVEWFREDLSREQLPELRNPPGDTDRKTFKPRRSAIEKKIKSDKARQYAEEFKKVPVHDLEHLIVEIHY
jgi:hypothetical protein